MARPKVYVAGPLGFTLYGAGFQRSIILALRRHRLVPLDPWTVPESAALVSALAQPVGIKKNRALARANALIGVANEKHLLNCDAVLAVLDGSDVDSGTAAEIGFASAIDRKIVGLRTDTRRTGDNDGAIVNLQVEYFIARTGGAIYADLDDAIGALEQLLLDRIRA